MGALRAVECYEGEGEGEDAETGENCDEDDDRYFLIHFFGTALVGGIVRRAWHIFMYGACFNGEKLGFVVFCHEAILVTQAIQCPLITNKLEITSFV